MAKQKIIMMPSDTGYDLAAAEYDKKEAYLNSFEKNRILPFFGDLKNRTILDVGAGTGRLSIALAKKGAKVTALDSSAEMLKVLSKKDRSVKVQIGDAESLPFDDNSFDFVLAAFLVVHLKDPSRFFDEAYRVLKDGGRLIVTNINQKEPPEIETPKGTIKIESYYHRPEKIRDLLQSLAFDIKDEIIIREKDVWVNQIIIAQK
ncbi:MAG: class I SAM-dependent methyltransferase [Candidatus Magasanikbacteria bacterium]|nr:class I SAM-dependent methyltransferase [Candidatus Magasanikbacteria bacterium]